jgi:hypothetical protein
LAIRFFPHIRLASVISDQGQVERPTEPCPGLSELLPCHGYGLTPNNTRRWCSVWAFSEPCDAACSLRGVA